jgi:hypothetical protein
VVVLSDTVFTLLVAAGYTTLRPEAFWRVEVRVKDLQRVRLDVAAQR